MAQHRELVSKVHVHTTSLVVPPHEMEPSGIMYLSSIDQHLSYYIRNLFFFSNSPGEDILVNRLKTALRKLLVPYNFYAGRLRINKDKRVELNCNNAGAYFAAATSSLSPQEITDADFDGFFLEPSAFANSSLDDLPLLTVQVTSMSDDGYVVGVMNHHIGTDAISGTYMMLNLACLARGEEICLMPDYGRDQLKVKSGQRKFVHSEFKEAEGNKQAPQFSVRQGEAWGKILVESENIRKKLAVAANMERKTFLFTNKKLADLKEEALNAGGSVLTRCSTFEVLAAIVWKAHSKAKLGDPSSRAPVKLQFVVDVRNILEPPLGINFCGNAYYPVSTLQIIADDLVNEPLSATVNRIQYAKQMLTDEYVRSGWEYLEVHPHYWYQHDCTTVINSWPRAMQKMLDVDFGWGKPHRVEYPRDPRNTKVFFFPFSKEGILVSVCLNASQFLEFERFISKDCMDK